MVRSSLRSPWTDQGPGSSSGIVGIRGVLVIGTIPEAPPKRSFELYRNALTGVVVITLMSC
jgi:hypothetical protein